MRKKLATATALIGAIAAASVALTAGASASNGGVYVVTPHSWGWCPASSVSAVYFFNQTTGSSGGDAGDDIVWVPVNLNQTNMLTVTVRCTASWDNSGTYTGIRPTRSGQAWYIGPGGGTWHN